jgi:hypothetical protein
MWALLKHLNVSNKNKVPMQALTDQIKGNSSDCTPHVGVLL